MDIEHHLGVAQAGTLVLIATGVAGNGPSCSAGASRIDTFASFPV